MALSTPLIKVLIHALALLPAVWLGWQGWLLYDYQDNDLTANPIQYINQFTGDWAIRFILIGLFITPIRKIMGWNLLIKFRRMVGLYAFFYVILHLVNFVILDHFFDWGTLWQEIIKRPAITFGMVGIILLIPLAVTSTQAWIRRLGKRWVTLHKMIYPIGIFAVVHNIMMVKADLVEPLIHLAILIFALGYRFYEKVKTRRQKILKKSNGHKKRRPVKATF